MDWIELAYILASSKNLYRVDCELEPKRKNYVRIEYHAPSPTAPIVSIFYYEPPHLTHKPNKKSFLKRLANEAAKYEYSLEGILKFTADTEELFTIIEQMEQGQL